MKFDLEDNQTAAKLYYHDIDGVTLEELKRFTKAINARLQEKTVNGTDMWELFVLQSAKMRLKDEMERK